MNGPPNGHCDDLFSDIFPNKLAEKRECIVNSEYEQNGQVFSANDFRANHSSTSIYAR
jgi:hypothetical protein